MKKRFKTKLLIVDCQVLQTTTFHRGMGRYSISLLEAFVTGRVRDQYTQILLLFNINILSKKETLDRISKFRLLMSYQTIFVNLPCKTCDFGENLWLNIHQLDAQLSSKSILNFDYLILSNFEVAQSLSVFPTNTNLKILLCYDIIPELFPEQYLVNKTFIDEYYRRFSNIFDADLIWTISATTQMDLIRFLSIPPSKVFNIAGGPIKQTNLISRPNIIPKKKFFLYPTGNEWRKNNEHTIRAFAKANNENSYYLVLTSHFTDESKSNLSQHSCNLIFTDNVSDEQLNWFYQNAEGVIFPSLYEGLGLPVLEALSFNKPILVSDIPSFREFRCKTFIYCDPYSIDSIKTGIQSLMGDKIISIDSKTILQKFNWSSTDQLAAKSLDQIIKISNRNVHRKIAIIGPDPEGKTAIGQFCKELLPALSDQGRVDFFIEESFDESDPNPSYVPYVWNTFPASQLEEKYDEYDQVIYNIGNNRYHILTLALALRHPGVVVLHDLNLAGLWSIISAGSSELYERAELENKLDLLLKLEKPAQMISSLIENSTNILVHSNYAKKIIQNSDSDKCNVTSLMLPVNSKLLNHTTDISEPLVVSLAGIFAASKGLHEFEMLVSKYHDIYKFFAFGFSNDSQTIKQLKEYDKQNFLQLRADVSQFEFHKLLSDSHFLFAIRHNYGGETSKTVLEAMSYGVVPVVSNIGWFSELPDSCVIKIEKIEQLYKLFQNQTVLREKYLKMSLDCIKFSRKYNYVDYSERITNLY